MRNPNGFGSIIKLSGKRRNPFAVRVTTGWTVDGKQIYKYIGYYSTRSEAMIKLAQYNANPYDIDMQKFTFADIFEKWTVHKYPKLSKQSIKSYNVAFKHLKPLHNLKLKEIRTRHLQGVFDSCKKGSMTKNNMKIICNQIFTYAIKHDITDKNYATYIDLGSRDKKRKKEPFTQSETELLWNSLNKIDNVDIILILIYTGLRINELLQMKNVNVHLEDKYMQGGLKTKAGKNRIIPINDKILPLIANRYNKENEYLICNNSKKHILYPNYIKHYWKPTLSKLNMTHTPHECRHTFASLMDNVGANKLSIKKIMGHTTTDITDGVYIHKTLDELLKAVNLI